MPAWDFYGRTTEIEGLERILGRGRWFFIKVTGRRRIGKTALIHQALQAQDREPTFYVQIPDSGPTGVVSAFTDALDVMGVPAEIHGGPTSLRDMATAIGKMAEAGYIVALDEFQYFHRKTISSFTSHLQAVVDDLSARAETVGGGLVVLGSVHTEMRALLEDKTAPLYNRTTDALEVDHLVPETIAEILSTHGNDAAGHLLFMWNLFEGVPKFYRDCYEQGVIGGSREDVIGRMFFGSSSPLRYEARVWFLSEFRGEYDVPLKYVASHPGCRRGDIRREALRFGVKDNHFDAYLSVLENRYRLIEKKPPIFAGPKIRQHRYYIRDNFLRSWLSAIARNAEAQEFRPVPELVNNVDQALETSEGFALEQLTALLYESRSRRGEGDFPLTHRVEGYWNSKDTEIDMVAANDDDRRIRFVTCRRDGAKLLEAIADLDGHIERFLSQKKEFADWTIERAAVAPSLTGEMRGEIAATGAIPQDLPELLGR